VAVDPNEKESKILKEFCSVHSNCILIISEDRISIYEAWNKAIDHSKADLLTNMNVDDLRSPSSLEIQVNFMDNNEHVDVGFQDILFYRDLKSSWNYVKEYNFKTELPEVSVPCLAWLGINPPHNAPVWRKNLHMLYGKFDSLLVSAGDYEFWLRICIEGVRFKKMDETHIGYYVNPTGMSTKNESPSSITDNDYVIKKGVITTLISNKYWTNNQKCTYEFDIKELDKFVDFIEERFGERLIIDTFNKSSHKPNNIIINDELKQWIWDKFENRFEKRNLLI
jgi:hypothetical protein